MSDIAQAVFILLPVLLVSMSIHEMMHAFAADWLGDPTARHMGRLTLNPIAHIDPFFTVALPILMLLSGGPLFAAAKPVQVNFSSLRYKEYGGAIVGMIGPVTNLLLAFISYWIFKGIHPAYGSYLYNLLVISVELNFGLFLFNSIPWPPLDGSRLLYAFAPRPLQELMVRIEQSGMMSILILIILFYTVLGSAFNNLYSDLIRALFPYILTP